MKPSIWGINLFTLLREHPENKKMRVLFDTLIDFMYSKDWRGACHESCGILYILINELGVECEWKLREVEHATITKNGRRLVFDHSWITINGQIIDIAICKTLEHTLDSAPTIFNYNLQTLKEPEIIYHSDSGWGDGSQDAFVKTTPLTEYFHKSTVHPTKGTWFLVEHFAKKIGLKISLDSLKEKYNGVFWT